MLALGSVILPGLGPVCPECFTRGHIAAMPFKVPEVYSFFLTQPVSQLDWDIDAARALVATRPRRPLRLDPEWIAHWLVERTSLTVEHLDHLPADRLEEPALLVEIATCPPGCTPMPFQILIDGNHRAARRVRDGLDVWAYLLTEQEQRSVCTYRRCGTVVEIPTLPGPGITELHAGIYVEHSGQTDHA
jgi:hypothetical protein